MSIKFWERRPIFKTIFLYVSLGFKKGQIDGYGKIDFDYDAN